MFSDNIRADQFGWDPLEATDAKAHEHAIYVLPHGEVELERLSSTFKEFVLDVCLGARFLEFQGIQHWDLETSQCVFKPAQLP